MQVKLMRCVIFTIILTFEAYFFLEKVTSHCSLPHFVPLPVSWTVEKCKKVARKVPSMPSLLATIFSHHDNQQWALSAVDDGQ